MTTAPDSLSVKAATGARWTALSAFVGALIQLVQLALLGRLVAPADFGLMAMMMVVVGIASTVADPRGLQLPGPDWRPGPAAVPADTAAQPCDIHRVGSGHRMVRGDLQMQPWIVRLPADSICVLYGNTGQSNQTSAISWLALLAVLYLAHDGRMPTWLAPVLVALCMLSSALTASRMAWLFLLLTVVGMAAVRPRWTATIPGRLLLAGAIGAAFVAVTIGVSTLLGAIDPSCKGSVARLAEGQEAGISARLDFLRQAYLVWTHSPWIGSGAGSFKGMVYQLVTDGRSQPLDTYAHNIVAQLLAEFGMLGVLSLLLVVAMCLLCVWRNRQELGAADALLLAWLGVIGTYSLLEFPLWYVHFLMFFALTLGLLVRPAWRLWTVQVRARLLVGGLSSAALAVCLGLFNDYRDLDRLMFLVLQKVENRIASSPEVNALVASADAEVAIYRTHADHMRGLAMSMTKEELAEKVEATDKLLSWAPTPPAIARRAVLAVLSEDQATAGYHLERLQRFFPRQAGELVEQMRLMAAERPAELGTLARLLDSNAASASQGRR